MYSLIQFSLITGLLVTFFWISTSYDIFKTSDNLDRTQQTVLCDTLWSYQLKRDINEPWNNKVFLAIGKNGFIYYTTSGK